MDLAPLSTGSSAAARLLGAVALLFALAMLLPASAGHAGMTDEEWQAQREMFEANYNASGTTADKLAAIEDHLHGALHAGAVDLILELQGRERQSAELQAALFNALATLNDPDCVNRIDAYVDRTREGLQKQLLIALGRIASLYLEGGDLALEKLMAHCDDRDKVVVAATCFAFTFTMRTEPIEKLIELFGHKKAEVKSAAVSALCELAEFENDCQVVIPALLDLARERKTKDDLKRRIINGLRDFTGYDLGEDPEAWAYWWDQVKDRDDRDPEDLTGITLPPPKKVPEYYGIPITDKNFVFVIDVSQSMGDRVDPDAWQRLKDEDELITPEDDPNGEEEEPERRPLPWDKIETKLDLAREEFIRAIENLPEDCFFGVVTYATEVEVHFNYTLMPANEGNKRRAIRDAEGWSPLDFTNIYGALLEAFKFSIEGGDPGDGAGLFTDGDAIENGPDAIFFLTDGFPTWSPDSTRLERVGGGQKGNGEHVEGDAIIRDIRALNETLGITIHCIGLGKHDRRLLIRLSGNLGNYVAIGVAADDD